MIANSLYWTTADLDVMPDDGGWLRHEIIAGELFVTRAPHIRHQGIGGNKLVTLLPTFNLASARYQGIDWDHTYRMPIPAMGGVRLSAPTTSSATSASSPSAAR